jgi:hypothetical protein
MCKKNLENHEAWMRHEKERVELEKRGPFDRGTLWTIPCDATPLMHNI